MWRSTGGTGMKFQSIDTTNHREDHNVAIQKRDREPFKSSAVLKEYLRMKGLRRGPMPKNGLKIMMMKFENTGDFGVAPGRGRRPIPMEVVDEVAVAVVDRAECAPNSTTRARAVSRKLGAWVARHVN